MSNKILPHQPIKHVSRKLWNVSQHILQRQHQINTWEKCLETSTSVIRCSVTSTKFATNSKDVATISKDVARKAVKITEKPWKPKKTAKIQKGPFQAKFDKEATQKSQKSIKKFSRTPQVTKIHEGSDKASVNPRNQGKHSRKRGLIYSPWAKNSLSIDGDNFKEPLTIVFAMIASSRYGSPMRPVTIVHNPKATIAQPIVRLRDSRG